MTHGPYCTGPVTPCGAVAQVVVPQVQRRADVYGLECYQAFRRSRAEGVDGPFLELLEQVHDKLPAQSTSRIPVATTHSWAVYRPMATSAG